MDTHTSSQAKHRLKNPEMRETELNVLQGLRNKGARKQREIEVVLGTLLKLLLKDKLLHSGKAPMNTELRPLRMRNDEWQFSDTAL